MKFWQRLSSRVLLALVLLAPGRAVAQAGTALVDCTKKEFKRDDSAASLYAWSGMAEDEIKSMRAAGTFDDPHAIVKGSSKGAEYCKKMISKRGSAWCQEPQNVKYQKSLKRLLALCHVQQATALPARVNGVDCSDKKFTHPSASVDQLLSWVEMSLRSLDGLDENEAYRVKPICADAIKYSGTAYCKGQGSPKALQALAKVQAKCQTSQKKFSDDKARAQAANKASIAAARARRKIVAFPKIKYRGADKSGLARAMRRAMLAGHQAKKADELLRVVPAGAWNKGRYKNKVRFQAIMGIVLWADDDNDGVCRFTSYNFIKDKKGKRWSKLRFRSFCNGCAEGWTKCNN